MTRLRANSHPQTLRTGHARGPAAGGFSLVELLTATGLAGLVFVVLMGLLDGSLRIYQSGSGSLQSYSEGRYALGRMSQELGAAVILTNTDADQGPGQPLPQGMGVALVQDHPSLGNLPGVVFVQQRRNSGSGDLIATAYRHDPVRFVIERAEISSDALWGNRDFALESLAAADWDWRPLCQGVISFDLAFFSSNELSSAAPEPGQAVWNSRNHGRPALGRLTLQLLDSTSAALLSEVGPESTAGQRLLDEKGSTLTRDILF